MLKLAALLITLLKYQPSFNNYLIQRGNNNIDLCRTFSCTYLQKCTWMGSVCVACLFVASLILQSPLYCFLMVCCKRVQRSCLREGVEFFNPDPKLETICFCRSLWLIKPASITSCALCSAIFPQNIRNIILSCDITRHYEGNFVPRTVRGQDIWGRRAGLPDELAGPWRSRAATNFPQSSECEAIALSKLGNQFWRWHYITQPGRQNSC